MFGSSNRRAGAASAPANGNGKRGSFSVLGNEVRVTGNVTAADLHLDGAIDGDVNCGALVLGANGHIAGSVTAESARIAGAIEGAVSVRELTVERGARISGDIGYETITIETGAQVDGQLRRMASAAEAADAPLVLESRSGETPRLISAEEAAA